MLTPSVILAVSFVCVCVTVCASMGVLMYEYLLPCVHGFHSVDVHVHLSVCVSVCLPQLLGRIGLWKQRR